MLSKNGSDFYPGNILTSACIIFILMFHCNFNGLEIIGRWYGVPTVLPRLDSFIFNLCKYNIIRGYFYNGVV